jgi:aquaporin Z
MQSEELSAAQSSSPQLSALRAVRAHWPEYLMEAVLLGAFMVSACIFCVLLEYPDSPFRAAITVPLVRRFLMGISMGVTAVGIIYSPWCKQSGAHINPSVTLAFLRLGKIQGWDAAFYIIAQFAGAFLGVLAVALFFRPELQHPAIQYVITVPGPSGPWAALFAEFILSFGMMLTVVFTSSRPQLSQYTGVMVGFLLVVFVTFEAPFSGMSINPARTFGSALVAHIWSAFWIYLVAPSVGMLAAAECYRCAKGNTASCGKLHHMNRKRCIFCGANGSFAL